MGSGAVIRKSVGLLSDNSPVFNVLSMRLGPAADHRQERTQGFAMRTEGKSDMPALRATGG